MMNRLNVENVPDKVLKEGKQHLTKFIDEKVNLKKRARQVKVEDSNVNPYQLFEANSTLDSTLNSSLDQTETNEEALVGSKKRKVPLLRRFTKIIDYFRATDRTQ